MTRYRGLDWQRHRKLECNSGLNPQAEQMNDGLNLDPFEVVFVKAKPFPRVAAVQNFLARYTEYALNPGHDLSSNDYHSPRVQMALDTERMELGRRVERCQAVFDTRFYMQNNPDLIGAVQEEKALQHFDAHGFYERRTYRFTSASVEQQGEDCRFE